MEAHRVLGGHEVEPPLGLPVQRLRRLDVALRGAGFAGGHNGVQSVIEALGTEAFPRLRFGVQPQGRFSDQVRFVLKNDGVLEHEFMLATPEENAKHAEVMMKYPEMEHDDPNGKRVKPNEKNEILWRFTKRGEFEFACLIPGHYQAGMLGKVVVK